MKKIYWFIGILSLLSFNSCSSDQDNFYEEQIPADIGRISLNNSNLPIYNADIYESSTDNSGGKIYEVTLSDNYSPTGTRNANVALYLEIYRPYNTPLEGTYGLGNATGKAVDFVEFYRNLTFSNGYVSSFSFILEDADFNTGTLKITYIGNDRYYIVYQFTTIYGDYINGEYTGFVSG